MGRPKIESVHVWENQVWIVFSSYYRLCINRLGPKRKKNKVHLLTNMSNQQWLFFLGLGWNRVKETRTNSHLGIRVEIALQIPKRSEPWGTTMEGGAPSLNATNRWCEIVIRAMATRWRQRRYRRHGGATKTRRKKSRKWLWNMRIKTKPKHNNKWRKHY